MAEDANTTVETTQAENTPAPAAPEQSAPPNRLTRRRKSPGWYRPRPTAA